jgi:hypothetical protein
VLVVQVFERGGGVERAVRVDGSHRVGLGDAVLEEVQTISTTRGTAGRDDCTGELEAGKARADIGDDVVGPKITETDGAVVVGLGVREQIELTGRHLHRGVVTTQQEGTPTAGKTNKGVAVGDGVAVAQNIVVRVVQIDPDST